MSSWLSTLISEIASRFGIGDKANALVGYLLSYITSPAVGGLGGFLSKIKSMGLDSILGSSTAQLTGGQVNSLFGNNIGAMASKLGLGESTVNSAVAMAVPALLAKLAPNGQVPATLPSDVTDLTRQFALPSMGSVGTIAKDTTASAWSWLTWLLPLIGLALLGMYLLRSCQLDKPTGTGTGVNRVGTGTVPTVPVVVPITVPEVTTKLQGLFTDATKVLGDVTDAASAKAAVPKLTELETTLDSIKAMSDKLPADGKDAVKRLAATELPKLQVIFDKLKNVGGVAWDMIKPYVDRMVEKLKSLGA